MADIASMFSDWASQREEPKPTTPPDSGVAAMFSQWASGSTPETQDEWETRGAVQVNRRTGATRPTPQFQGAEPGLASKEPVYAPRKPGEVFSGEDKDLLSRVAEFSLQIPEAAAGAVTWAANKLAQTPVQVEANPADIYGHGIVRDVREKFREQEAAARERGAQVAIEKGLSPASAVAGDWGTQAVAMLADPMNAAIPGVAKTFKSPVRGGADVAERATAQLAREADPALDELASKSLEIGEDVATRGPRIEPAESPATIDAMTREGSGVSPEALPEPSASIVERRADLSTRRRIDEMTPDEMRVALKTDELTGLGNRRALSEEASQHIASVDVDGLKYVNDTFGHQTGDDLLKEVGEAIKAETPRGYRKGGDEFVVLGDSPEEIDQALSRIHGRLSSSRLRYTAPDGTVHEVPVGISHGIGETEAAAEEALRAAKEARIAQGLRAARGEPPPGLRTIPRGEGYAEEAAGKAPQATGAPPEVTSGGPPTGQLANEPPRMAGELAAGRAGSSRRPTGAGVADDRHQERGYRCGEGGSWPARG